MKRAKTIHQTAKNASKLHKIIGIHLSKLFPNYEVRQEYAVNKVNESFHSGREKFDWVVLGLKIVCEIHGEQHYKHVCFGGISMAKARKNFEKRVEVDKLKEDAARDAGWAYLVVKYTEKKITEDELFDRVNDAIKTSKPSKDIKPAKPKQKIAGRGFSEDRPKQKIQSREFQKAPGGNKWPKRKINN